MRTRCATFVGFLLALAACTSAQPGSAADGAPPIPKAKNVIVMIADGTGWYSWDAAAYFRHGKLGEETFDKFSVKVPLATYPLTNDGPGGGPNGAYDPDRAWDETRIPGDHFFAGYDYVLTHATDSAAAATAMAAGVKTYNGAIGVDVNGQPVPNLTEIAKRLGKSAGVITSVPLCHATPAGFVAHTAGRNSYRQIAQQMLQSNIDVIMGAGHPLDAQEAGKFDQVGGPATWRWLQSPKSPWKLVQTRAAFDELADDDDPPQRVVGVPMASSKLPNTREEGADNVPTLATMARGAINVLNRNPNGFFLMVEGGAPDWGAHNNKLDDLINELSDFYDAIEAVVAWIEGHGGWEQNLLIVTTDHGNGLLLGPDSDTVFQQPIINEGEGALPRAKFHTKDHVNELVRLYAKGAGAEMFRQLATAADPHLKRYRPGWGAHYGQNTDVFVVAQAAMTGGEPVRVAQPVQELAADSDDDSAEPQAAPTEPQPVTVP